MFLFEDPAQGSTEEQNKAIRDLERLTCPGMANIMQYLNDYLVLAARTGRAYIDLDLSNKLFMKMPDPLGNILMEAFNKKYPGPQEGGLIALVPRIYFCQKYLQEMCQQAALQRSLKDLSFCSKIPIPGYYSKNPSKKYGLRKSKTYKGKPHDSHVHVFKRKHADKVRKCKCFICGEEGHFAKECKKNRGNITRAAVLENLDIPEDWDVVSVDQDEPDSDAICSMSEGETGVTSLKA